MAHGLYSPEYCECFARKRSSDLMTAYPFKEAINDDFTSHFKASELANNLPSTSSEQSLLLPKIKFGESFDAFLKIYGKPELFNASYERNLPFRVAGFKGKNGKVQFKNLLFFSDKTFVMNEFHVYNGTEEKQLELIQEILSSKGLRTTLAGNMHELFIDKDQNCLLVMKLAFGITISGFNKNNNDLIQTCIKLRPDTFEEEEDEGPNALDTL
jgi:hypothetical protein